MKTLAEIRELFVSARNLAKEASPARVKEAAEKIKAISDHCKELYEVATSYMERAKCRNMFESLDNIVQIMLSKGFIDERVGAFFGLLNTAKAPSFSDISRGNGTIMADPDVSAKAAQPPIADNNDLMPMLGEDKGAEKAKPKEDRGELPPPPPAAKTEQPRPLETVPTAPVTPTVPVAPVALETVPGEKEKDDGNDGYPIPADDGMAPQSLDDFIGQDDTVRILKEQIAEAKILGKKHLDHIMLFGNRGLGKSTLIKIIARELGVRLEFIDCTSLMNDVRSQRDFNEFFQRISERGEPVVIALDEIHALPERLQSNLLTLLNDRVYNYLTSSGTKTLPMPEFTFIGATTDPQDLLQTLRDRCKNLTFTLVDYTRDQLREIFNNKFRAVGLVVNDDLVSRCINRCRSSIRDVNAIVKGLRTKAVIRNTCIVKAEMLDEYFSDRGLDEIGLNKTELEILEIIKSEPKGVISAETLSARLYLAPEILVKEYEPYLLRIGFISIVNRGRVLTPKAEDYLRYGYYEFGDGTTVGTKPAPEGDGPEIPVGADDGQGGNE